MRICIVGAGAIGGYMGARLALADLCARHGLDRAARALAL